MGTFLSALVLIPLVGTRRTFLAFALALALAAVPALQRRFVLAPVGVALLLAIPVGTVKATGDARVIWDRETEYQYARVTERPNGERRLELNEGQAVHSVYRPGEWLTHDYWDEMLVLPFATARPRAALGGHPRQRRRHHGARLRPLLPGDARRRGGDRPARSPTSAAASSTCAAPTCTCTPPTRGPFLRRASRRWDVIIVDAYRQPYIPFYLATREFFGEVRDHLTPGGMVLINVGHPRGSDRLEKVLGATMGRVFSASCAIPSSRPTACCSAPTRPPPRRALDAATRTLPPDLAAVTAAAARPAGARAARRRRLHRRPRAGRVADRRVDRARGGGGRPVGSCGARVVHPRLGATLDVPAHSVSWLNRVAPRALAGDRGEPRSSKTS